MPSETGLPVGWSSLCAGAATDGVRTPHRSSAQRSRSPALTKGSRPRLSLPLLRPLVRMFVLISLPRTPFSHSGLSLFSLFLARGTTLAPTVRGRAGRWAVTTERGGRRPVPRAGWPQAKPRRLLPASVCEGRPGSERAAGREGPTSPPRLKSQSCFEQKTRKQEVCDSICFCEL